MDKSFDFIIVKGQDSDPSDCRHAACLFILHNNMLYDIIIC